MTIQKIIDSHIHLDMYEKNERNHLLQSCVNNDVEALITVSNHYLSAKQNIKFAQKHKNVYAAIGYHPEQKMISDDELQLLITMIEQYHEKIVAIGEVGLPYYLRKKDSTIQIEPYIRLLETFIEQAKQYNKPIILHAIYEDAEIVCDLLEQSNIKQAHFHWFKGNEKIIDRLIHNAYYISITPDLLYEAEIRRIVEQFPLSLMMVETDGPWPFAGPFHGQVTHPKMIHSTIKKIAKIKSMNVNEVYTILYNNTRSLYNI